MKRNGYYSLFYSAGNCCGTHCSYRVEVARSVLLQDPYIKFTNNPILAETQDWKCTGHGHCNFQRKDFYLYHAYCKTDSVYTGRQGMLAEVTWDAQTGWPCIHPQGENAEARKNFRDDFVETDLSYAWQWDFRHSQPDWKLEKGNLYLAGKTTANNLTGTALTIRPLTGDYEIRTEVMNRNASLKGLVLYGDAGQATGIAVHNNMVQVWEVKNSKKSILAEQAIKGNKPLLLKMTVEKGYRCHFYWSEGAKDWKEIKTAGEYYNGSFLPIWDRSPRPRLVASRS